MAATTNSSTNWKVNNWHWVEKNCLPWAKQYISEQLSGLRVETEGVVLASTDVSGFSGDADINQRKGKLITVFDVAFNVNWNAELAEGNTISGRINVPEFMHDTDSDEMVIEVTTEVQSAEAESMRLLVVKHLVPLMKSKLTDFSGEMIRANGKDVHIPKEEMKGHPTGTQYKPKPVSALDSAAAAAAETKPAVPSSVLGSLATINLNVEFVCSAADLYSTLLDQGRVQAWSRGPASIKPEVGAEVKLFGGNVEGKILELVPNKKIVQTWRLKTWPANHYSTVTLTFEEGRESVMLRLEQTEVPVGEKDLTTKNWKGYYFDGIKAAFGYGAVGL
ncbi:activator of Hsp90 ATPase [Chytriomyces sp. MP71]|nr:activator of Hsp90 ATPase [Chytriomyces sp. MP71]